MTLKKKCRACRNSFVGKSLLQLAGMPPAVQNLPVDKGKAVASSVVLDVRQCSFCGLVQLSNDPVPYYKDVIRAGSISPSMKARQRDAFKAFINRFSLKGKNILEIGSGRGEYLSILGELDVRAFGMENNPGFNKIAKDAGLKLFAGYPTDLPKPPDAIAFDAFISINFLEHAPDPGDFLRSSARLLCKNGVGMVSVPDFESELRDNGLFSFISDHLSYFSSDSLRHVLSANGFEVIDVFRNEKLNVVTAYCKKRGGCDLSAPRRQSQESLGAINSYVDGRLKQGGRIALWGASHLAFSIIAASKIGDKIAYIVDSAPFKQGRFSPASGLKIHPPRHLAEDPVDTVIILCPEYSAEIAGGIKKKYPRIVRHIATFADGRLKIIQ